MSKWVDRLNEDETVACARLLSYDECSPLFFLTGIK